MNINTLSARLAATSGGTESSSSLSALESLTQSRPLTAHQQRITDNLDQLLEVLPPTLRAHLDREDSLDDLLEIVMDLGRIPE
jgi:hypothetical protein